MRKSAAVPLTILAAVAGVSFVAATGVSGCNHGPPHCVDAQNHLMPDGYCQNNGSYGAHYVYGGSSGGHYGDSVVGSSVSRGGFGGFGGGGGE